MLFHVDTNFSCPAFFHVGQIFFSSRIIYSNCIGLSRGIAASFTEVLENCTMNANLTSTTSNELLAHKGFICLCRGNCLSSNNNHSFNTGSAVGVGHIYSCYASQDLYSCFYNNTTGEVMRHSVQNTSLLNVVKFCIMINNKNSGALLWISESPSFVSNSTFFGNTKYTTMTNVTILDSFSQKNFSKAIVSNIQIIETVFLTTTYGTLSPYITPITCFFQNFGIINNYIPLAVIIII